MYKPDLSYTGYIYGETLAKAKYQFYLETDGYGFMEFFKDYSFRRDADSDYLAPVRMDILNVLTEKEQNIIFHANGNDSKEPGYRSYYNLSIDNDKHLLSLISLGLMHYPQQHAGGGSYNYFLTKLGGLVAMSALPIQKHDLKPTLAERKKVLEWSKIKELSLVSGSSYEMHMFKQNINLKDLMKGVNVYIRSGQWGSYWRSNCSGYTESKRDAGAYDFDEAYLSTSHCGEEKQISFEII
jgi:hypothetical protein